RPTAGGGRDRARRGEARRTVQALPGDRDPRDPDDRPRPAAERDGLQQAGRRLLEDRLGTARQHRRRPLRTSLIAPGAAPPALPPALAPTWISRSSRPIPPPPSPGPPAAS